MFSQYVISRRGEEWVLQTAGTPGGLVRSSDLRYVEEMASLIARRHGGRVLVLAGGERMIDGRVACGMESANDPTLPWAQG